MGNAHFVSSIDTINIAYGTILFFIWVNFFKVTTLKVGGKTNIIECFVVNNIKQKTTSSCNLTQQLHLWEYLS